MLQMQALAHKEKVLLMMCHFFFLRNYLEWMVDLPWSKETTDKLDISQAR